MTSYAYIESEKSHPKIFSLMLNRPEKMNAFSGEMLLQIHNAVNQLSELTRQMKCDCVIVKTTQPKAFCAGADLAERIKMSISQVSDTLEMQNKIMNALASLEVPTLASIQGIAFGGGLELALACDLRLSSPDSKMGLTETKLAIIPGAGGTQRLSRLVGLARAKELIFKGTRLKATDALNLGLVNALAENPDQKSLEWALEIVQAGPLALRAAKKALNQGWDLDLSNALTFERECYDAVLNSEDRIEGLKAFVEKRDPVYKGK
jgi:methylglutaconyl-CoA hydratase